MKIIFQIDGGIGKSIAATAVCKAIKKQYPNDELLVITGYPEVFLCNPNVDRVFNFNNLNHFYQDHIEGRDVKTFLHNPYLETDFINLRGHLIQIWCEMFGIKYSGEQPELFLTNRELSFYAKNFASQKPVMLIQTNGGAANQQVKYSWTRDLPIGTAQRIVNFFANQYNVVHIRRDDQPQLQNTTPLQADFRAIAALISMSHKRLFIDSFCQHAAAALGKPSVVCWIGNTPSQFGYDIHTNILANEPTIKPELRHSVFSRYNISGQLTEFPYNSENEIFDINKIVASLVNDSVDESKPKEVQNLQLKDKITVQSDYNSSVARRLSHLAGKVDLTGVKRILDIGSWHLGQSVEFSEIFKDAEIDAFEPVPDSYQLCLNRLQSLDEQKQKRIRVHNYALSDAAGEIPFYIAAPDPQRGVDAGFSSMFKFNEAVYDHSTLQQEIRTKATRLDDWCAENKVEAIDIMWVDVQGSELLMLQGADNILRNTKIIMTEVGLKPYYEGHALKDDIDKFLGERGFVELKEAFEFNGWDLEANTIYIRN